VEDGQVHESAVGRDDEILNNVRAELVHQQVAEAIVAAVSMRDGIVTLSGTVASYAERLEVADAAAAVRGVRGVVNNLEVAGTEAARTEDAVLERAVRTTLEWDIRVPSDRIDVEAHEGVVRLSGVVDRYAQRERVELSVRYVRGVRLVVNEIAVAGHEVTREEVARAIDRAIARRADRKHIEVDIDTGAVTVRGRVRSFGERRAVVESVGQVQGVLKVVDHLEVVDH
jgi:osmotically-inducible protein OsmY